VLNAAVKNARKGVPVTDSIGIFHIFEQTHCIYIGKEKRNIDVLEELRKKNKKKRGK